MRLARRRVRTRTKRQCFCNGCNGKFADPRTKANHILKMSSRINYQETGPSNEMDDEMDDGTYDIEVDDIEIDDNEMNDNEMNDNETNDNEIGVNYQEAGLPGILDDIELDYNETDDNAKKDYSFLMKKLPSQLVKKGKISERDQSISTNFVFHVQI